MNKLEWHSLGLPDDKLPAVMDAFGTPAAAKPWIRFFDDLARTSRKPAGWNYPGFMRSIADSGLNFDDFLAWHDAGLEETAIPRMAVELERRGATPDDLRRWCSEGQSSWQFSSVLEFLELDEALRVLRNWKDPDSTEYTFAPYDELLRLMRGGFVLDDLRSLLANGFRGHDVFQWWRTSRIPISDWPTWHSLGIPPDHAQLFADQNVVPDAARDWIATGIPVDDIMGYLHLGCTPSEASGFAQASVHPWMLRRTPNGLEEFDPGPALDPWEEDPAEQLPEVINPGRIGMTLWANDPDGSPKAWDVAFAWAGGRAAEWSQDISLAGGDLSPASSSPITGTIDWAGGRDIELTYQWSEGDSEGNGVVSVAAPADDVLSERQTWIRLGFVVINFLYQELY